jgi:glycerol kinase
VKVDYSNVVVIENADITVGVAAVLNSNYGEKPITIKNSKLNILGTWTRNNTWKTNYVFEGNNTINTFIIDAAIDNFKLAGGATLTAPNAITVTTDAGYTVEYTDGKYISKNN